MRIFNAVKSESLKYKRSKFYLIHFLVPLFGALIMWLYFRKSSWDDNGDLIGYITIVAAAFPFMISVVTAMSVQIEEENSFMRILSAPDRKNEFVAKYIILNVMGAVAAAVAMLSYAGLMGLPIFNKLMAELFLMILLQNLILYSLHLFFALRFGKSMSIFMGVCGTLISMVFLTGLGEKIWKWVPASMATRTCNYLILLSDSHTTELYKTIYHNEMMSFYPVYVLEFVLITGAVYTWFLHWEGRKVYE